MSDIDEKKPTGKAGKRKRNAEQRNRKFEQKQQPKADPPPTVKAQVDTVPVASTDAAPIEAQTETPVAAAEPVVVAEQAFEAQADTAIIAAEAVPDAVAEIEQHTEVMVATADTLPVVTPYVSEPPAAETAPVELAPVAAPELKEQIIAPAPPEVFPDTAPVSIAHVPVSLQAIANAYGDYTRKSLEQTKCFIDKLTGVQTLNQAVEIQTEFAKQACETFVTEAQKIHDLHRELARQRFERLEGLMSMGTQAPRSM